MVDPPKTAIHPQHPPTWKALAVLLPFLLLFWVDIWHHTMFFDEVNAWGIAAASPTLAKLFFYVHYEGHPWLWYFILWFPSRLTHDPVAMKWVEAALGTAIIAVLGLLSPFTLKQRALILSSYFLVWEYTVMCRMYSVMLLCVLLYVVLRIRNPRNLLGCSILLGIAANTDMAGMLLASALLIEFAYTSLFTPTSPLSSQAQHSELERSNNFFSLFAGPRDLRRWLPALAVYIAFIALAVATLWPSKDISWQSSGRLGSLALNRHHIDASFGNMIAAPWWPISPHFPHHFWETSIADAHWLYLLVPFVLFTYWITFRRHRSLLLLMACTLTFGILFADVVYVGRPRHWGIAFVSFIVGLWLQAAEQHRTRTRQADLAHQASRESRIDATRELAIRHHPHWSPWTYALLTVSAAAGVCAIVGSWMHPFSRAREAATWIRATQPPNAPITGMPDVSFASLAEELQRPVWFLECQCVDTFKLFSKEREDFPEYDIPTRLDTALTLQHRQQILFAFFHPLAADDLKGLAHKGLSAELVQSFPDADMKSESYFFYQIRRVPPNNPPTP